MEGTVPALVEWKKELQQELNDLSAELKLKEKQLESLEVKLNVTTSVAEKCNITPQRDMLYSQAEDFREEHVQLEKTVRHFKEQFNIRKDILNRLLGKIDEHLGTKASS